MNIEYHQERDRITMLRELLQMSQTEFARQIGISQGALSQIENGRSRVSMETLKNLSTEFNVNCNWLVNGKGDIFYSGQNEKRKEALKSSLIPLIDKKARAGYYRGFSNPQYLKTLALYQIPGFEKGEYRMFEIHGESMVPSLFPGEIVIGKRITSFDHLQDNTLVVILLSKELIAKRIHHSEDRKKTIYVKCDNLDYDGRKVKTSDIKELWTIEGKLTRKFLKESIYDPSRIQKMEKNLIELQSKVDRLIS